MSMSFDEGYRAVSWFFVKFDERAQRQRFASTAFSYLSKVGIRPYVGVCFGKFSRVVDFFQRSAKIASFHLGALQTKIADEGIKCSFSTVLCKPFEGHFYMNETLPAINAYTFFKPASKNLPYNQVLSLCKELCEVMSEVALEAYWNNSMYPLILIIRGEDYPSVVECIRRFRVSSEWAVDSSSYITLKVDPLSHEPVKDKEKGKVCAIVYLKLSSLSDIEQIQLRFPDVQTLYPSAMERFGWYDACVSVVCKNLCELYEYVQRLKDLSNGKITFSSTLLLKEGTFI